MPGDPRRRRWCRRGTVVATRCRFHHAGEVTDLLLTVLALIAAAGGIWWVVTVEPHWCSRDGRRFVARVLPLDSGNVATPDGPLGGRWREVRVRIDPDTSVMLRGRGLFGARIAGEFDLRGRQGPDRRRRMTYVLSPRDPQSRTDTPGALIAMRIPATSRATAHLDARLPPGNHR